NLKYPMVDLLIDAIMPLMYLNTLAVCCLLPLASPWLFMQAWAKSVRGAMVALARQMRNERVLHQIHFNCSMTVPSEIVGRATPVLLAFLAIHSRATRVLSSAPALS